VKLDMHDHVIVNNSDGKKVLLQVANRHGNTFTGIVDNEYKYTDSREAVNFSMDDVLAVIPPIAPPGKVYGLKVEPINSISLIKPWGEVAFRRYVVDSEKAIINRALVHTGRIIHQCQLSSSLPINIEIRPHLTKEAGMYIYTKKVAKLDTLVISPDQFHLTTDDEYMRISILRLIMHEFSHHIWHHYFTNELRTRWIRLYHHTIKIQEAGKNKLDQLHKDFIDSSSYVTQYRKYLKEGGEETELELFNSIIKYILTVHKLTGRHLNILLGEGNNLADYWPTSPMQLGKATPVVSMYATKNVDEFFAESLSFMSIGVAIPAQIANAINTSMKMIGGMLPVVTRPPAQRQAA
jgi:hypothetical protein